MAVFNGAFPIIAGKEEQSRAFAAEVVGARAADFASQQGRSSVTRETWTMQTTPMGAFMLVWFEGDVESAFGELAADQSEFATWFKGQVLECTGFDLGAPPEDAPPEVLVDWSA